MIINALARHEVTPEFRVFERKYPFTFCLIIEDKGTNSDQESCIT